MKRKYALIVLLVALLAALIAIHENYDSQVAVPVAEEQQIVKVGGLVHSYSLAEIVEQSSLIVVGYVLEQSEPIEIKPVGGGDSSLFTDWTVEIESVYRGDNVAGMQLDVRAQGGENGDLLVVNENVPVLVPGEAYVLCLYQPNMGGNYNTEGDYYYITGLSQGAFALSGDQGLVNMFTGEYYEQNSFIGEVEELSKTYPVDDHWLYNYNVSHTTEQRDSGQISQAEFDEFWERMSQYATIIK